MKKGKQKHEKILCDSRASITIVRTASTAGSTGPTHFLLAGKKAREGYSDAWVVRHGGGPGSGFVMTPNAFMTDEAWLHLAEAHAKGIRQMPVIKDHPE